MPEEVRHRAKDKRQGVLEYSFALASSKLFQSGHGGCCEYATYGLDFVSVNYADGGNCSFSNSAICYSNFHLWSSEKVLAKSSRNG